MIGQGIPAIAKNQELITTHICMDDTDVDSDLSKETLG